jgi:hypothetical protein
MIRELMSVLWTEEEEEETGEKNGGTNIKVDICVCML